MAAPLSWILNNSDISPPHSQSSPNAVSDLATRLSGVLHQPPSGLDEPNQEQQDGDTRTSQAPENNLDDIGARGSKRNKPNPSTPAPLTGGDQNYQSSSDSAESHKGGFDIFKELLEYPELIHEIASQLELDDLVSLYAISKDFHRLVNNRLTAIIVSQANTRAPESAKIFAFKCYRSLCIFDPMRRQNEERKERIRDVPGFRWLRMIMHRETVVDEIIRGLAIEGHRLPKPTSKVIKKMWFLMDIPDSSRRVGVVHNPKLWPDPDLYLAFMFFMKLDMRFTDPVDGNGEVGLRQMMMAQRSLVVLDRVLRRKQLRDQYDLIRMCAEWRVLPTHTAPRNTVFGVPWQHLGRLQCEGWKPGKRRLLRPDEVIMREAVRRELDFEKHLIGTCQTPHETVLVD